MEPQAVWAVIAGVLILALGVFLFAAGDLLAPYRTVEILPRRRASGLYRISTKFGGICFMAAGAFIALLPFLLR